MVKLTPAWPIAGLLLALCVVNVHCTGDKAVPFKRPSEAVPPNGATPTSEATAPTSDAGPTLADNSVEGTRHIGAPDTITVDGAPISRGRGHIHASLATGPGDPVLLLTSDEGGGLQLEAASRQETGFEAPKTLFSLSTEDLGTCRVISAELHAVSSIHRVASASVSCTPSQAAETDGPGDPGRDDASGYDNTRGTAGQEDDGQAKLHRRHWVIGGSAREVLKEFTTHLGAPGAPAHVRIRVDGGDLDGDGHADITATLTIAAAEPTSPDATDADDITLSLQWLDRPSGLARRDGEPESAFMKMAERARGHLGRRPAEALRLARQVLDAFDALCRERTPTGLAVGRQPGLPCGSSRAVARAASVLVVALAKKGDSLGAVEARALLDAPFARPLPIDKKRADAALTSLAARGLQYRFVKGPPLPSQRLPSLHRPRVSFVDEDRLLLRGYPSQVWDAATHDLTTTGAGAEVTFKSPDGRLTATEIFRDCDGYHLALVPTTGVVQGVVVATPEATPLIATQAPPTGADCPLKAPYRRDAGGLSLLDYSGASVVLRRGANVWQVALAGDGGSSGPPPPLHDGTAAQPSHGRQRPAGGHDTFAFVTDRGIVVKHGGTTRLVPAATVPRPIAEVSVSPSGRRLAVVQGQQVWLGEPDGERPTSLGANPL